MANKKCANAGILKEFGVLKLIEIVRNCLVITFPSN